MTRLSAQALLDRALECSRAGRYDEALAHYAQLIQHFPGDSVAYYNRGCLYERHGKLDLAVADFREAYRLDPDEPGYRQALATASYNEGIDYAKGGDDARALIAFEEALRINPGNADYRHNVAATRHSLGVRYFKKQDYEHAKAEFQEALRLCPKNKVYRQCLAATEHNLRLGARTRDDEADAVPLGREQRSALDDEDTNPRIKRHLAAVPVTSSWPGQPAGYSNPDEKPIFSGDGRCPKCQAMLWIDWKLSYDMMACPGCRFEFDGAAALSVVTSHEPGKNSGNFERVREAIRMKKEAVIRQMRSEQPPQLPAPPPIPTQGDPSRQSVIAAMTGSGGGKQTSQPIPTSPQPPVKKREPGLWHRVRSLFQPNTDKCPNCQESLAGEYVGEETIARRERLETRPMPILDARGHFVGEQLQQVVVEDVVWWRYLRCKFCGYEWREKRSDTFQL